MQRICWEHYQDAMEHRKIREEWGIRDFLTLNCSNQHFRAQKFPGFQEAFSSFGLPPFPSTDFHLHHNSLGIEGDAATL